MTLKGEWNADTQYAVGDVVRYDGIFYHLQKECGAGVTPIDTLYWGRLSQILAQAAKFVMDLVPQNISDEAITLTANDVDYLITVDDSGDTPELEVTAIEEE